MGPSLRLKNGYAQDVFQVPNLVSGNQCNASLRAADLHPEACEAADPEPFPTERSPNPAACVPKAAKIPAAIAATAAESRSDCDGLSRWLKRRSRNPVSKLPA